MQFSGWAQFDIAVDFSDFRNFAIDFGATADVEPIGERRIEGPAAVGWRLTGSADPSQPDERWESPAGKAAGPSWRLSRWALNPAARTRASPSPTSMIPVSNVVTSMKLTWSIVLLLTATAAIRAQGRPDFSGRWVLVAPKQAADDVALALTVNQTLLRTNVFGAPMEPYFRDITIERQFKAQMSSDYYLIGIIGGTVGSGPSTHVAVTWKGNALFFETGSSDSLPAAVSVWSERHETWSLNPDGHLVVVINTSSSAAPRRTTTGMYRRP